MSNRGWITSGGKTWFLCQRFKTRMTLLYENKVKYKIDHFTEIRTNYLFLIGALVDEIKCEVYVLGKSRSKHILISPKLMSRLSYYRIYDVQSRYLVLWPTL